jgi:hypothetical protein
MGELLSWNLHRRRFSNDGSPPEARSLFLNLRLAEQAVP